ncbi:MAG: nuclear transport factor 2 family protein [SAR202 cluster bacterium]|nr:nuclear transport factor 2 family protein [SAR202 cluster bacterium]
MATEADGIRIVERFNDVFNTHDVDAIMGFFTDDCLFESISPAPDGSRAQGQAEVRAFWDSFFRDNPTAYFETEELFGASDRYVVRWRFTWRGTDGGRGYVRGADIMRLRDGKVAEKLAYVKMP